MTLTPSSAAPLRGIAWDHDRALAPLKATAREWAEESGIEVVWDARSLKDFGEVPVSDLVRSYDLVVIDHPFIARAAQNLVLPIDELLSDEFIAEQAAGDIGGSHRSYTWDGHQWALAIDAAAQVMAVRADLLDNSEAPTTWSDVLTLAGSGSPVGVGMPMNPTDVVPTFLSICGALGERPFSGEEIVSQQIGIQALELMRSLARQVVPWTLDANPIGVLEGMASDDEVAVVPLVFGYTNYSRAGYRRHVVSFRDVPARGPGEPPSGATLGGAGLAISARTPRAREAADYAAHVAKPETQAGTYVTAGGQPGHASAWQDPDADRLVGGFFSGTRKTMNHAYMRPRHLDYLTWQDAVGDPLCEFVRGTSQARLTMLHLEKARLASRTGGPLDPIETAHRHTTLEQT